MVDRQQTAETDFTETGVSDETRAKTAADGAGVDVASVHSIASVTETNAQIAAPADGSGATALTYSIGAGAGEATIHRPSR